MRRGCQQRARKAQQRACGAAPAPARDGWHAARFTRRDVVCVGWWAGKRFGHDGEINPYYSWPHAEVQPACVPMPDRPLSRRDISGTVAV